MTEENAYVRLGDAVDRRQSSLGSRVDARRASRVSLGSQFSGQLGDTGTIVSDALSLSSSLGWRMREEADLLWRQGWWVVFNCIVLVYGTMFVFLNLAFYRFPVEAKRLKDLGHEIIPPLPDSFVSSGLVDLPLNLLLLVGAVMLFSLFVNNATAGKRNPKPNCVNVVLRGSSVYAIGHCLRALTYLSTSPPGSSDRCLADAHPEQYKPTLAECFYTAGDVYHNCGDLMFSGHMMLCLVITYTLYYYGESAFWISRRQNQILVVSALFLCVVESVLILAARHHYTSDIVVAWYVTPLLYYYYNTVICPRDLKPDLEGIAQAVLDSHGHHVPSPV